MDPKQISLVVKLDISPPLAEDGNTNQKQLFHGINLYELDNNGM